MYNKIKHYKFNLITGYIGFGLAGSAFIVNTSKITYDLFSKGEYNYYNIICLGIILPTVIIAVNDSLYSKSMINVEEIKARKGIEY